MQRWFKLVSLCVMACVLAAPNAGYTEEAAPNFDLPKDPSDLTHGRYLLMRANQGAYFLDTGWFWSVYSEPKADDALVIGTIQPIANVSEEDAKRLAEAGITIETPYVFTTEVPVERGLFGKLTGASNIAYNHAPFEILTVDGREALPTYDKKSDWFLTSAGWVQRDDEWSPYITVTDWARLYQGEGTGAEFVLPKSNYDLVPLAGLNEMRASTSYDVLGKINVYPSPNFNEEPVAEIESPLRLAVLEIQGQWLRVFIVKQACAFDTAKKDFREGTIGWVRATSNEGYPQIARREGSCD